MKSLNSWVFEGLSKFLLILPRRGQMFIGSALGVFWFEILRIRRQVALDNIKNALPNLSDSERLKIARAAFINVGHTVIEVLMMIAFSKKDLSRYFVFRGEEHLYNALKEGKGALLLSMHLGNGDFACMALALKGHPLSLISKQFRSQWLNDFWFQVRAQHGTQFIREEKSTYDILSGLKNNRGVIFVLDQFMGPPVGVRTKFFGIETGTAVGLSLFAERNKAPVIPVYNFRRDDGIIEVVIDPPILFEDQGDREKNKVVMTQRYNDKIESCVRKHPGQWMWIHKRWKEFRENG